MELLVEEHVEGDALTGRQVEYLSMSRWLKDKGVALPDLWSVYFDKHIN